MSVHFEKLRVKQVRRETSESVSIVFDIPEQLKEQFYYKQGQHLTLRTFINGEEIRRSYSLCSSPLEDEWRVAVKKSDGGLFSTYANDKLKTGDVVEVMPPMGFFYTEVDPKHQKSYVAIAAGSGITPVISIIKTVLATEQKSNFTLIYGNRTRSSVIFREELEALKNKYMSRFSIIHILSREVTDAAINYGRIDANKCAVLFNKPVSIHADEFFLCGPEEMIFTVKDFLEKRGVEPQKIHFELFTTAESKKPKARSEKQEENTGGKSRVTAKLDGISFDFEVDPDGDSILNAALEQGADLPYSCRGGMCCTCKARLLEGKVEMDVHYGLEEHEVGQGYILTCQSHPRTERVIVDFDIK